MAVAEVEIIDMRKIGSISELLIKGGTWQNDNEKIVGDITKIVLDENGEYCYIYLDTGYRIFMKLDKLKKELVIKGL